MCCSSDGDCEKHFLVRCDAVWFDGVFQTFRRPVLLPSSGYKADEHREYLLYHQFTPCSNDVDYEDIFLWSVMLYSLMDCLKRFEGHLYFHLQDTKQTSIENVCCTIISLIVPVSVEKLNKRNDHSSRRFSNKIVHSTDYYF